MARKMTDYAELRLKATTIRDEVEDGRNTAERVGGMLTQFVEAANEDFGECKDSAESVVLIQERIAPKLLLTDGTEDSDITKCTNANKAVKYLFLNIQPNEGHRFVLNFLYRFDNLFEIQIYDLNLQEETHEIVLTGRYNFDQMVELEYHGNVLGSAYISKAYFSPVQDEGEGLFRLPYLNGACFQKEQGWENLVIDVEKNAQDIEDTNERIDEVNVELSNLREDYETDYQGTQTTLSEHNARINANNTKSSDVNSRVSNLEQSINGQLSSIQEAIENTNENVEALQNALNNGTGGHFYGYFKSAGFLPQGEDNGFAYVGLSAPFAIYVFNGSTWSNSGATFGDIQILADEEDLTQGANGKLSFKNRDNSDGKAYIILRKNATFYSQVANKPNTIFEIRYNFDLNGANFTFPNDCVLKFNGGCLSNFTKLIGKNTSIDSADTKIFDIDAGTEYIDGIWNITEWRSSWFGAIADGTIVNNQSNYKTTFDGTDNYNALQAMLNAAYQTNVKNAYILSGFYKVNFPLNVGFPCQYNTIRLRGASTFSDFNLGNNKGKYITALLINHWQYGLSINGSKGSSIEDLNIIGRNYCYAETHSLVHSLEFPTLNYFDILSYVGEDMRNDAADNGLSRFAPFAGVVVDALGWETNCDNSATQESSYYCAPYNINSVTKYQAQNTPFYNGTQTISQSSRSIFKNVLIQGFGVGLMISPNNRWGNNEFTIIEDSRITDNVIGIAQGNRDARHTAVNNTIINGGYCGIDTIRFGCLNNTFMGLFQNCNFDGLTNIFEIYRTDDVKMINCYCENTLRFGSIEYVYMRTTPMVVYGSTFFFKANANAATPTPDFHIAGDNIIFDACEIWGYKNVFVVKYNGDEGDGCKNIVFRDCRVFNTQVDSHFSSIIFTSRRPFLYGFDSVKSNQLDGLPNFDAANRNAYTYRTRNNRGYINRKIASTQGWNISHYKDANTGLININFGEMFSAPASIKKGDIITNNVTSIVLVVQSIDDSIVTCRPLSGYKMTNGIFDLSDNYYGDYFFIQNVRQVPLNRPAYIVAINGATLTLNYFDTELFKVGNLIDFEGYDDTIDFETDWHSEIIGINATNKTITLANAPSLAFGGMKIRGVIVNDETAYGLLNLTD